MANSRRIQLINEINDNVDKIAELDSDLESDRVKIKELCAVNFKLNTELESLPVIKKVGRNHPCPCGSGKKYKNCHNV